MNAFKLTLRLLISGLLITPSFSLVAQNTGEEASAMDGFNHDLASCRQAYPLQPITLEMISDVIDADSVELDPSVQTALTIEQALASDEAQVRRCAQIAHGLSVARDSRVHMSSEGAQTPTPSASFYALKQQCATYGFDFDRYLDQAFHSVWLLVETPVELGAEARLAYDRVNPLNPNNQDLYRVLFEGAPPVVPDTDERNDPNFQFCANAAKGVLYSGSVTVQIVFTKMFTSAFQSTGEDTDGADTSE